MAVWERLNQLSVPGKYIITEPDDFYDVLPDDKKSAQTFDDVVKTLKDQGYLELRYAKGELYCMAPLKKNEYSESEEIESIDRRIGQIVPLTCLFVVIVAFLGSFLGSLLANVL